MHTLYSILAASLLIFLLLLFTILLLHLGRSLKANIYLAVYFISQIAGILYFTFLPYYHGAASFLLFALGQSLVCLWGPLFYMFFRSLIRKNPTLTGNDAWHLAPGILTLLFILVSFSPSPDVLLRIQQFSLFTHPQSLLSSWFDLLILFYMLKAYFTYKGVFRQNDEKLHILSRENRQWLKLVLYGFAISSGIVIFNDVLRMFTSYSGSQYHLLLSYTIFLIYFSMLFYISISKKIIFGIPETKEKYSQSKLSDREASKLLRKLENFMIQEQPYIDPELSLHSMANHLQLSHKLLSQLVNAYKHQNFSDYINFHRIQHAKHLLEQPEYARETIYSILVDSGFNSKTSFNQAFKKWVGCTPIQYKRQNQTILSN